MLLEIFLCSIYFRLFRYMFRLQVSIAEHLSTLELSGTFFLFRSLFSSILFCICRTSCFVAASVTLDFLQLYKILFDCDWIFFFFFNRVYDREMFVGKFEQVFSSIVYSFNCLFLRIDLKRKLHEKQTPYKSTTSLPPSRKTFIYRKSTAILPCLLAVEPFAVSSFSTKTTLNNKKFDFN